MFTNTTIDLGELRALRFNLMHFDFKYIPIYFWTDFSIDETMVHKTKSGHILLKKAIYRKLQKLNNKIEEV